MSNTFKDENTVTADLGRDLAIYEILPAWLREEIANSPKNISCESVLEGIRLCQAEGLNADETRRIIVEAIRS